MENIVQSVKTHIVFHFANGDTYELPLKTDNPGQSIPTFGRSVKLKEALYTRSSKNIVGNIVGNTLDIEITSLDKMLLPTNPNSVYYGYMNDTAYVDVTCDVVDDNNYQVYMGRYLVDTWEGGNTSNTVNEVSISCVDILSRIKNIAIDKMRLRRNISFNEYLQSVIDKVNTTLPSYMRILYDQNDFNIWKNSEYAWQMYFNNIDRDNVENLFNCIAKYTISYIWIDRNRHIKTDHLLDDRPGEAVGILSGSSNLLSYGTQTGGIDKYSGVKVKYISAVTPKDIQLLEIKDTELYAGENSFIDQKLSSDKVWDIHTIEVKCESGKGIITSFINYKDSLDFTVEADRKTKATITVFGTILDESYETIEKYKDNNIKDGVIEIENRVLIDALVPTYVDGLINLMTVKNNQVYAEGFINPRIKLGDLVRLQGLNMNINDYYKVTGLEYNLGTNYKCKATMIKTFETERNIEDILYIDNELLLSAISGENVNQSSYVDITAEENTRCEQALAVPLAQLRAVLQQYQ